MLSHFMKRRFSSIPSRIQNKLLINGKFVPSSTGKTFKTYNPADETVISEIYEASEQDVNDAVAAARKAFDHGPWRKTSGRERGVLMHKLADLIEKNIDELSTLEALDNGKTFTTAKTVDFPLVIRQLRYDAGWADKAMGQVVPVDGPYLQYVRKEPVGVCAQIVPWNFPALMFAWKVAPALAAGCTIVIKPAEQTPLSALRMGELVMEAGFPEGVFNIVSGDGKVGKQLSQHKDVDKVAFTGSTEVGYEIMRNAHKHNLKRITLELGGKSPNIILDDADMDLAISQSQLGIYFNHGQCCIAGSRVYVQEGIYDEFVKRTKAQSEQMKVGGQFEDKVDQGPQVSQDQLDKILGYIKEGSSEGANLLTGGNRVGTKGYFVEPTVFTDVQDDMKIAREEIFGPVMSVLKFKTIDEVIERANKSSYGLGAGLVTSNIDNAFRITNALRVGTVYVNCYDVINEATTFGGFKDSGVGRELGPYGIENYLEKKNVIIKLPNNAIP